MTMTTTDLLPATIDQSTRIAAFDRYRYASWLAITSADPFIREVMAALPSDQRVATASIVAGFRSDDPPHVALTLVSASWGLIRWPTLDGFDVLEGNGADAPLREARNGSIFREYRQEFRVYRVVGGAA